MSRRRALAALTAVALIVATGTAGALDRLEAGKRVGRTAIDRRIAALSAATVRVQQMPMGITADEMQLKAQLQAQTEGLTALQGKIDQETSEAALRADLVSIVQDYRVFVLTVPKSRGVVIADIEEIAAKRLDELGKRLQAAIDAATAKGKDMTKAKADLDALRTEVAAVQSAVGPVPGSLLALQPAGYPGNRTTLESARVTLRAQRASLRDAVDLARQVVMDLRA
jgi:hypothetical protein